MEISLMIDYEKKTIKYLSTNLASFLEFLSIDVVRKIKYQLSCLKVLLKIKLTLYVWTKDILI